MKYHPLTQHIQDLLKQNNCWFETFEHEPVRTSEEAAKVRTGYSLEQGAKALIIQIKSNRNKEFVMLVLPGSAKFASKKVKEILQTKDIRFATQEEINTITDGVQIGGIPPFGNLFNIRVISDKTLFDNEKIIFNAGDRGFSIAIKSSDYMKVTNPIIAQII